MKTNIQKTVKSIKKNPIIFSFIGISLLVILYVSLQQTKAKDDKDIVYATIKVSQGFWWSKTEKPAQWYVDAISVGDTQKDFLGNSLAEIISKKTYPYYEYNQVTPQYNIFITLKLKVEKNKKTNTLIFNRNSLAVGSPIELQFPTTEVSGTVIRIQDEPPKTEYVEKIITLSLENGYKKEFPYMYNNIPIGDNYNDGDQIVFEVLDKKTHPIYFFGTDDRGITHSTLNYNWQNITIKAKIIVQKKQNQYIFGEEQKIFIGGYIDLFTDSYYYSNFKIVDISDI
jgi:hypothetical protein